MWTEIVALFLLLRRIKQRSPRFILRHKSYQPPEELNETRFSFPLSSLISDIEQNKILDENFTCTKRFKLWKNRRSDPHPRIQPIDNYKKKINKGRKKKKQGESKILEGARIGRKVVAAARRERVSIGP